QCEANVYNYVSGKCTLLGPPVPGSTCSLPYANYERRETGCAELPQPPSDQDYTPGQCSQDTDVVGPSIVGSVPACGNRTFGQRRVAFDAILHNGTHLLLENHQSTFTNWDAELGSWFFNVGGNKYYFKSGTCFRPPA
ncbi:hypothetical protein PENTCL1PPCAC_5295, partial [Pristionchus entomophagus]